MHGKIQSIRGRPQAGADLAGRKELGRRKARKNKGATAALAGYGAGHVPFVLSRAWSLPSAPSLQHFLQTTNQPIREARLRRDPPYVRRPIGAGDCLARLVRPQASNHQAPTPFVCLSQALGLSRSAGLLPLVLHGSPPYTFALPLLASLFHLFHFSTPTILFTNTYLHLTPSLLTSHPYSLSSYPHTLPRSSYLLHPLPPTPCLPSIPAYLLSSLSTSPTSYLHAHALSLISSSAPSYQ